MALQAVSTIIATFNRAELVCRAVRSALAASSPDDEVIVADDGSTDNTKEALDEFGGRIRYARFPHAGCGPTRNHGVRLATRPLVAFLDSDDEWDADKLQLQRAFMAQRPDVLFCFSDFCCRLDSGDISHNYLVNWHHDLRSWDEILGTGQMYSTIAPLPPGRDDFRVHIGSIYLGEMESNYVATSVVMVRREEAGQALRFSEDLKISQDKECFGRLAKVGLAAYFACETGTQWGHEGPRMTDANTYDRASARLTLLDRIWASDPAFVAQYGDRLEQARQEYRMRRARWLLARGRTREARADLRAAGPCPLSYRMLASLPEPVARGLLKIRRLVRGKNQLVAGGALSC